MSSKRSKTDAEGNRGWADLHEDILLLIKEKLKIVDQLRFKAVCRSWRLVPYLKSADKLPWILAFRQGREAGNRGLIADILYDPSNSREYSLGYQLQKPHPLIMSSNVYYSKFGWVFLASNLFNGDCKFSLHHVFTRTTIDLPSLSMHSGRGRFSTTPTRSDCVFCVTRFSCDHMVLSIYCNGDVAWSTFSLKIPGWLSFEDMFYRKGQFYFVFDEGLLWAFDIASHGWKQVATDTSQITNVASEILQERLLYKTKVVESNGEVLLVYFFRNRKPWYIFKLDWSLMAWVKEATLGNRALFLGETSLSVPTGGEIKCLAGHIHFQNKNKFNHYSFKNNVRHKSSRLRALVNKYYSCFNKAEREPKCNWVWVEPHS